MGIRGDDRAQAVQIGFVLVLGFLIIGLTIQQAVVVPQQNREVEFNHFSQAQNEMEELRNDVIYAGQTGRAVASGVSLGTTYPARIFAVQPSRSSGTLETETIGESGNAVRLENTDANMSDVCGIDSPTVRSAAYQPSYNYLNSVENVTYENTVTYTSGNPGGRAIQTDQQIVDGTTVHLYPLVGEYYRSGSGMASVTLRGGETGENASVPGPFTLVLPTTLSASEWQGLLGDQEAVTSVSNVAGEQAVRIAFAGGRNFAVRCSPTGAGAAPDNTPAVGTGSNNINPNFGSDVILRGVSGESSPTFTLDDNELALDLENTNTNGYQNMTFMRFPFYNPGGQGSGADPAERMEYESIGINRIGPYVDIGTIEFAPGERKNVTVSFYCDEDGNTPYNVGNGDFFVFDAVFDNGNDRTYFVAVTDSGTAQNNRC